MTLFPLNPFSPKDYPVSYAAILPTAAFMPGLHYLVFLIHTMMLPVPSTNAFAFASKMADCCFDNCFVATTNPCVLVLVADVTLYDSCF